MSMQFDFNIDKDTQTIHVTRAFAAGLDVVWDAWTKPDILDQWWAPKPYKARTKELDLREGGRWLYCMISPEGVVHWSAAEFVSVMPRSGYTTNSFFCDENGNAVDTGLPSSRWTITFKEDPDSTTVDIVIKLPGLAELEQLIAMGFQGGFTMGLNNLEEYLRSLRSGK